MRIKLSARLCFLVSISMLSCNKTSFIEIQNNESYLVEDKLVLLTKRDLKIEDNGYLKFQDEKGNKIPCQFLDSKHDGNWDNVSLLVSIPANGK